MKILIAGYGSIGKRHFRNLRSLGEDDILFFRTHQSSLQDDELEGFTVETELGAALDHQPRAVIVANPTALHLDVAIPAAQAGCHLLLEKPISHSLERVDELAAALQRGGGQVLVGFQFRFHPGLGRIADLLAKGAIGVPLSARAHWGEYLPSWHPWEDYRRGYSARSDLGGGVILTLCHPLDYLHWLLGEVRSLWAFSSQLSELDLKVEDTAEIGIEFASGVLGSVHLDYNQRPPAHRLEIIGTRGTIRWDYQDGGVQLYQADSSTRKESKPNHAWKDQGWVRYPLPEGLDRNQMFLAEMEHFLSVARGETAPQCSLEDGVQALRMALAAHQSAREKKLVSLWNV